MYLVELDIYSGRPNPSWMLSDKEEQELVDRIVADKSLMLPLSADTGGLGYRGYVITALDEPEVTSEQPRLPSAFRLGGTYDREKVAAMWLLDTSQKLDTEVDDYLRGAVQHSILESTDVPQPLEEDSPDTQDQPRRIPERPEPLKELNTELNPQPEAEARIDPYGFGMSCVSSYLTSATDFSFWNADRYVRLNNCYNFASNHRTNSLAQPGRYAKRQYKKFSCSSVADAIVYDGWRNSCQHRNNLSIALVIWPGQDFHFYRKCSGGRWCHKRGKTPAKNVDESGKRITSPETCNRADYTQFCGYWYVDNGVIRVS